MAAGVDRIGLVHASLTQTLFSVWIMYTPMHQSVLRMLYTPCTKLFQHTVGHAIDLLALILTEIDKKIMDMDTLADMEISVETHTGRMNSVLFEQ